MAITLDELLGRTTDNSATSEVSSFPAYDEFIRRRQNKATNAENSQRGNFDSATREQQSFVANGSAYSRDNRRDQNFDDRGYNGGYQNNSQYREPGYAQNSVKEYSGQGYAQNSVKEYPSQERPSFEDNFSKTAGAYNDYRNLADTSRSTAIERKSLYEFTANDCDRLDDASLEQKLGHTDASRRPVFDRNASATAVENNKMYVAQTEKSSATEGTRKRKKINTKGKIILSVYVALIVVVAVLIIVNAKDINKGMAKTPSAEIASSVSQAFNEANSANFDGFSVK